ncbi:MAG TPA: glycosyltransferase [Candidatus Merdicola faecigallinarum]|uniref:Glycosyltransferase n=1 Tax=Candidatus Merdicola faecigallinarum TaxID=2840862 RepID=A0A9D1M1M5_9FIRM|nr:glycosyltransferase [Candidatus Merdicola faecigallinarum]
MVKVSVIVPFYNVESYIGKCLESLVHQTLREMEIILVNDGSKDGSAEIAKQYVKEYPNQIKYVEKENGGLGDARNYGIPYAEGEYIAFLDSDDYVEPIIYEALYEEAKEIDADMVECDFIWEYPKKKKEDIVEKYSGIKEMLVKARVVAWNKLIRKEIVEKNQIQFPPRYRYEDVEFFYKLAPFIQKVGFVKMPLIHYIQRENSLSNHQNERTKEIFYVLDHVLEYYKKNHLYEEYKVELEYIYARYLLCSSLKRMAKVEDKTIRKGLLKETWNKLNTTFPEWKENEILNTQKTWKNRYIHSVNGITFKIYSWILGKI